MENGHNLSLMSRVTTVTSLFLGGFGNGRVGIFGGYTVMMQQRNMKDTASAFDPSEGHPVQQ